MVRAILLLTALVAGGCASPCHADLSGNFSASSDSSADCASLMQSMAPAGGWVLGFSVPMGATTGTLQAAINLGPAPTTGSFSSETATSWSLTIANAADCLYSAGDEAVPTGSFTLNLSSLSGIDGGNATAHGDLQSVLLVHAPAGVDCGKNDVENVSISF